MGANLRDCNERSMTEGQTGAGRRACGRTRVTVLPLSSVSGGREGARASAIWGYVFAAGFVRRFRESAIDVRPTAAAAAVSCFWKEEKMVFDSGGPPIDLRSTHNNKLIAKVTGKSDGDSGDSFGTAK